MLIVLLIYVHRCMHFGVYRCSLSSLSIFYITRYVFSVLFSIIDLYIQVGIAFLAGLGVAILLLPINKYVATKIGEMSKKMMRWKDERVKVMIMLSFIIFTLRPSLCFQLISESIGGIRSVKMSLWETHFEARINSIRERELYYLKIRKYLDAVCVYLWASAPLLISVAIFATYTIATNGQLTAAKVHVCSV